jgi:uncharacterized BrkB/YihY/UPF0761 family membrane protein
MGVRFSPGIDNRESVLRAGSEVIDKRMARTRTKFFPLAVDLFKQTGREWIADDAPQLGAALAYYTVFSLAPMVLLLLAVIGVLFRDDPAGAWSRVTEQMSYFLDKSAVHMVQHIARQVSTPAKMQSAASSASRLRFSARPACLVNYKTRSTPSGA